MAKILHGVRIVSTRRLPNSKNGNPRFVVIFDDGSEVTSQADAAVGHGLENSEYRDHPHDAELSPHGTLVYLRRTDKPS